MKSYARRNKRMQLSVKYHWRGMAKSNTRKLSKRLKVEVMKHNDVFDEYEGSTLNPKRVPRYCEMRRG